MEEERRAVLIPHPSRSASILLPVLVAIMMVHGGWVLGADITIRGNNVTIIQGLHQMNGSIIVEENGTLILRNAVLNFTPTEDYEFETKLYNPRGGTPRLIIEDSEIITNGGYQHQIGLFDGSKATIRGLATSEDVRINVYWGSTLEMSNSVIRGGRVYGRAHSRLNITSSSMFALGGESDTQIYVKNSEINDSLLSVISLANATIQGLRPGHAKYWDYQISCSTRYLPGALGPIIIVEDSDVWGFSFHLGEKANVTIKDSDLKKITATRDAQVWIHNTTSDYGITAMHDSIAQVYDSHLGPVNAMNNSTISVTNCTTTYDFLGDHSQKAEYWYLELTVVDPAGTAIPRATITVTHPDTTIMATGATDTNGEARFTLEGGVANATAYYPTGPYDVATSYLIYTDHTSIEMTGNQKHTITLPIPIPQPTAWMALLATLLLTPILRRGHRDPRSRYSQRDARL